MLVYFKRVALYHSKGFFMVTGQYSYYISYRCCLTLGFRCPASKVMIYFRVFCFQPQFFQAYCLDLLNIIFYLL